MHSSYLAAAAERRDSQCRLFDKAFVPKTWLLTQAGDGIDALNLLSLEQDFHLMQKWILHSVTADWFQSQSGNDVMLCAFLMQFPSKN